MRALALMLSCLIATSKAAPCGVPKISGMSYHYARAKLITAGFRPLIPPRDALENVPINALEFGYVEGDISQGRALGTFQWEGFTVHTDSCELGAAPCKVLSVTCQ